MPNVVTCPPLPSLVIKECQYLEYLSEEMYEGVCFLNCAHHIHNVSYFKIDPAIAPEKAVRALFAVLGIWETPYPIPDVTPQRITKMYQLLAYLQPSRALVDTFEQCCRNKWWISEEDINIRWAVFNVMTVDRMATYDHPIKRTKIHLKETKHTGNKTGLPVLNVNNPRVMWDLKLADIPHAKHLLEFAMLVLGKHYDCLNCSIPARVCFAGARLPITWSTPGVDNYCIVGGEALRLLLRPLPEETGYIHDPNRIRGFVDNLEMSDIDILATSNEEVTRIITAMQQFNELPENKVCDKGWTCVLWSPSIIHCVYADAASHRKRIKDVQIIRGAENQSTETFISAFDFAHNMVWVQLYQGQPQIYMTLQALYALSVYPALVVGAGVGTTHTRLNRRAKAKLKGWDVPELKTIDPGLSRSIRFGGMPRCFSREEAKHRMSVHFGVTETQFVSHFIPQMQPLNALCGAYYEPINGPYITQPMIKIGDKGELLNQRRSVIPHITINPRYHLSKVRAQRRRVPWSRFNLRDLGSQCITKGFEDTIFLSGHLPRCAMRVEMKGSTGIENSRSTIMLSTQCEQMVAKLNQLRHEIVDIIRLANHAQSTYTQNVERQLSSLWKYVADKRQEKLVVHAFCDEKTVYYNTLGMRYAPDPTVMGIDIHVEVGKTYMIALRPFAIRARQSYISFFVISMQKTPHQ